MPSLVGSEMCIRDSVTAVAASVSAGAFVVVVGLVLVGGRPGRREDALAVDRHQLRGAAGGVGRVPQRRSYDEGVHRNTCELY